MPRYPGALAIVVLREEVVLTSVFLLKGINVFFWFGGCNQSSLECIRSERFDSGVAIYHRPNRLSRRRCSAYAFLVRF